MKSLRDLILITDVNSEIHQPREPLLKSHPSWPTAKSYLSDVIICPLENLTEQKRLSEPTEAIGGGNHK